MATFEIPAQIFILVLVIIIALLIIIVVVQWRKVKQSQGTIQMIDKEIELKKMSMVEKDLEAKRLMENPIPLPKDQQDHLSSIRKSTSEIMNDVGFKHNEINERLALLEAQTEQKKLEKMLKEIEAKEKKLQREN